MLMTHRNILRSYEFVSFVKLSINWPVETRKMGHFGDIHAFDFKSTPTHRMV